MEWKTEKLNFQKNDFNMSKEFDYFENNRKAWNAKTDIHIESAFYDVASFLNGATSLKEIERPLLGDISGQKILHLQCHFGQDSISMSRMGASVTAIDISDVSIERAQYFAQKLNTDTTFICCNIYDLPQHLHEKFDIIFTSYGTIGWLPDLKKWGAIISLFLKPGGKFIFAEFHPVVWMFDDQFEKIGYSYFNTGPIIETYNGTYANPSAELSQEYVMWNHGLTEVFDSLISSGLQINSFKEYNYSPYNCFKNTVELSPGKFSIKGLEEKIPMVYSLVAVKPYH